MRRAGLQLAEDRVADGLFLPPQSRVPKAEFLDPQRSEKLGPLGVVRLLVGETVLSAVQFDGEAGFAAVEIQEVFPDGVVAPEFVGAEAPVAQPTPHEFLRPSGFLAQGAGAGDVGHGGRVAWGGVEEKSVFNVRPHPERLGFSPQPSPGLQPTSPAPAGEGVQNGSLMNARPHPNPLPQERENRSPRLGDAKGLRCRAAVSANDQTAAMTLETSELYETCDRRPLSLGERARVRASQNTNQFLMNTRPHPGLLPQEKENRSPRFGDADAPGYRAAFSANGPKAAMTRKTSEFSRDVHCCSLSPGERARVRASQLTNLISSTDTTRASVTTILCSTLLFCLTFATPLRADDVITEIMSPIVSYQYPEGFSTAALTSGGILSPIASYVFCEWPGDDVLRLQSSPWVSYYYPGIDGPQVVLQGNVTGMGGAPLMGAAVSAAWGNLPVAATSTDANGNYALPLGAGVYALTVSASGYAQSSRVLTLSAGTAPQNFQLAALPPAPDQQEVIRSPVINHSAGSPGELKVFDGENFISITGGNAPQPDRMTIVMTHGFDSNPEAWARGMARQMRDAGVTAEIANILCWDWRAAAVPLAEAYGRTGDQGIALGRALQERLGVGYFPELHFLGHSLGTLVNAAAVNFLRGDKLGHEEASSAPWLSKPIHVTMFDHAERANLLNQQLLYDGLSLNLVEAADRLSSSGNYTWEWQRSMPARPTWADNYVSLFGFRHAKAVNVRLQKSALNPLTAHSYAWWWYGQSIENPTDALNPLGFGRSLEYLRAANLPASLFPPSAGELPPGSLYEQSTWSLNPLALERNLTAREKIGILAGTVVQGTVSAVQTAGQVLVEVRDAAQAASQWIAMGFDAVGNAALLGGQSLVNLFDSAVLRLQLITTSPSPSPMMALRGAPVTAQGDGDAASPPMAWLPIEFPADATAMAFDFTVEGDPEDDVLVCGVGTNNLFSLAAKYIPTNTMSASRLIDVSAWAGTTSELFFGFMGGTSTDATLVIENIRFYSLDAPRLEIHASGNMMLLSWPLTAGGYVLETTPTLSAPTWEAATNAPVISADRYVLTNSWSDEVRFFRLQRR